MAVTSHTFTAAGPGASATNLFGGYNLEIRGSFVGTVQLERSLDGTNWVPLTNAIGNYNSYDKPASFTATENETTAQVRWNCTNFVSGSIVTRISN